MARPPAIAMSMRPAGSQQGQPSPYTIRNKVAPMPRVAADGERVPHPPSEPNPPGAERPRSSAPRFAGVGGRRTLVSPDGDRPRSAAARMIGDRTPAPSTRKYSVVPSAYTSLSCNKDKMNLRAWAGTKRGLEKRRKAAAATSMYKDPEAMYEEIQQLKMQLSSLGKEKSYLASRLRIAETEQEKLQDRYEEMVNTATIVNGLYGCHKTEEQSMRALKRIVRENERRIAEQERTIQSLKKDFKYTRMIEMEVELQTYFKEILRMQRVVADYKGAAEQLYTEAQNCPNAQTRQDCVVELKSTIAETEQQNKHVRELAKTLKQENTRLAQENEKLSSRLSQLEERAKNSKQETAQLAQEKEKLTLRQSQLEEQAEALKQENVQFAQENEMLTSRQVQFEERARALKADLDDVRAKDDAERRATNLQRETAEAEIENLKAEAKYHLSLFKNTEERYRDEIKSLTIELRKLTSALEDARSRDFKTSSDLEGARSELEQQRKTVKDLRSALDAARAELSAAQGRVEILEGHVEDNRRENTRSGALLDQTQAEMEKQLKNAVREHEEILRQIWAERDDVCRQLEREREDFSMRLVTLEQNLKRELGASEALLIEARNHVKSLEGRLLSERQQQQAERQQQQAELAEKLRQHQDAAAKMLDSEHGLKEEVNRLRSALEAKEDIAALLEAKRLEGENTNEKMKEKIWLLDAETNKKDALYSVMKDKMAGLEAEVLDRETKNKAMADKVGELEEELETCRNDLECAIQMASKTHQDSLSKLPTAELHKMTILEAEVREREIKNKEISDKVTELEKELETCRNDLKSAISMAHQHSVSKNTGMHTPPAELHAEFVLPGQSGKDGLTPKEQPFCKKEQLADNDEQMDRKTGKPPIHSSMPSNYNAPNVRESRPLEDGNHAEGWTVGKNQISPAGSQTEFTKAQSTMKAESFAEPDFRLENEIEEHPIGTSSLGRTIISETRGPTWQTNCATDDGGSTIEMPSQLQQDVQSEEAENWVAPGEQQFTKFEKPPEDSNIAAASLKARAASETEAWVEEERRMNIGTKDSLVKPKACKSSEDGYLDNEEVCECDDATVEDGSAVQMFSGAQQDAKISEAEIKPAEQPSNFGKGQPANQNNESRAQEEQTDEKPEEHPVRASVPLKPNEFNVKDRHPQPEYINAEEARTWYPTADATEDNNDNQLNSQSQQDAALEEGGNEIAPGVHAIAKRPEEFNFEVCNLETQFDRNLEASEELERQPSEDEKCIREESIWQSITAALEDANPVPLLPQVQEDPPQKKETKHVAPLKLPSKTGKGPDQGNIEVDHLEAQPARQTEAMISSNGPEDEKMRDLTSETFLRSISSELSENQPSERREYDEDGPTRQSVAITTEDANAAQISQMQQDPVSEEVGRSIARADVPLEFPKPPEGCDIEVAAAKPVTDTEALADHEESTDNTTEGSLVLTPGAPDVRERRLFKDGDVEEGPICQYAAAAAESGGSEELQRKWKEPPYLQADSPDFAGGRTGELRGQEGSHETKRGASHELQSFVDISVGGATYEVAAGDEHDSTTSPAHAAFAQTAAAVAATEASHPPGQTVLPDPETGVQDAGISANAAVAGYSGSPDDEQYAEHSDADEGFSRSVSEEAGAEPRDWTEDEGCDQVGGENALAERSADVGASAETVVEEAVGGVRAKRAPQQDARAPLPSKARWSATANSRNACLAATANVQVQVRFVSRPRTPVVLNETRTPDKVFGQGGKSNPDSRGTEIFASGRGDDEKPADAASDDDGFEGQLDDAESDDILADFVDAGNQYLAAGDRYLAAGMYLSDDEF